MNIPRENSNEVKEILSRKDLNNNEKAILIHSYDYNCLCRETNGRILKQMSEGEIIKILDSM